MGYTKNIAIIRGLKRGFSADGGQLSGLVKAEKYSSSLKVEVSLINFAPLSEGKYVAGITDGKLVQIFDDLTFDGTSDIDISCGFGVLICFVHTEVLPIASAICGVQDYSLTQIKDEIDKSEKIKTCFQIPQNEKYEDEALAQENYYEYEQVDKDSKFVCENKKEEEGGQSVCENEKDNTPFEEKITPNSLARGECFYKKMKKEIENLLTTYPKESQLEKMVENSKWVKITYNEGKFYVFGVIYAGVNAKYICYGVPTEDNKNPPESMASLATFIPSSHENKKAGFWVMFQDANTGASIKITKN